MRFTFPKLHQVKAKSKEEEYLGFNQDSFDSKKFFQALKAALNSSFGNNKRGYVRNYEETIKLLEPFVEYLKMRGLKIPCEHAKLVAECFNDLAVSYAAKSTATGLKYLLEKEENLYRGAIALEPDFFIAYENLGKLLKELKREFDYQEVISAYNRRKAVTR